MSLVQYSVCLFEVGHIGSSTMTEIPHTSYALERKHIFTRNYISSKLSREIGTVCFKFLSMKNCNNIDDISLLQILRSWLRLSHKVSQFGNVHGLSSSVPQSLLFPVNVPFHVKLLLSSFISVTVCFLL